MLERAEQYQLLYIAICNKFITRAASVANEKRGIARLKSELAKRHVFIWTYNSELRTF